MLEQEPHPIDLAADAVSGVIEWICYAIILGAPLVLWIMTPAGMQ